MKVKFRITTLTLSLVFFSNIAFAHPGHEHSYMTSDFAYAVLFIALFASVGTGLKALAKSLRTKIQNKK